MSEVPANPESAAPEPVLVPFESPSEYTLLVDRVLALARSEILVFEQDLEIGGWNAPARFELLRSFLLGRRGSRMQIVVHDTGHIERHAPRLTSLLRDFSNKFSILRTVEDGRNAWDGFVLVDGRHHVHRFHLERMRGELGLDAPMKTRDLHKRYEEILVFTEPGVNATLLGL